MNEETKQKTKMLKEFANTGLDSHVFDSDENPAIEEIPTLVDSDLASCKDETDESSKGETNPQVLKFRVICRKERNSAVPQIGLQEILGVLFRINLSGKLT